MALRPLYLKKLEEALEQYVSDTFSYIHTVKEFISKSSEWIENRKTEINTMATIQETLKKMNLSFIDVMKSENRSEDLKELIKNIKPGSEEKKQTELQEELVKSQDQTLVGLKELEVFLEAVEKLAVTSVHVFAQNQVLQLCDGADLKSVQEIIFVAQLFCPLLLSFKRDNKFFFSPKIQNLEVMMYQLTQYVMTIQEMCAEFSESSLTDLCCKESAIEQTEDVSEEKMLSFLFFCNTIRMDKHFRMLFLFREEHKTFMKEFKDRKARMLEFLEELEPCAVQLDEMNKGARISGLVGSSLGAVGGALSIAGLLLSPVTAGVSLGLTIAGGAAGVTSGANSIVTTATGIGVNKTQVNKANEVFQKLAGDMTAVQKCMDNVVYKESQNPRDTSVLAGIGLAGKVVGAGKTIDSIVDAASAFEVLQAENIAASASKVMTAEGKAVCDVSKAASEIPDLGQAALKGPLAMSKAARYGLIGVNAVFIGLDVFAIVKNSIDLSKGSETEISKWIRARAALSKSEIDSWQKIYDSLEKALQVLERKHCLPIT